MILTVTDNKVQVIDLICENVIQEAQDEPNGHCLIITSADSVPFIIHDSAVSRREDLTNFLDEANG